MRHRRTRLNVLLVLVVIVVVGAAALLHTASGNSGSPPPPSPRPAVVAFSRQYLAYLAGQPGVPAGVTSNARSTIVQGGRIPSAARAGEPALRAIRLSYVSGATRASALVTGRDRKHSYQTQLTLRYEGGQWLVSALVPPDFEQVLARRYPAVTANRSLRAAARRFALAYAGYREGVARSPVPASSAIGQQLAQRQDPLAGVSPSGSAPQLQSLKLGPPSSGAAAASAVLTDRGAVLRATFIMQLQAGRWRPFAFPETG